MNGPVVVTWRIPETPIDDVEQAIKQVDRRFCGPVEDRPPGFVLCTCQRVLLARHGGAGSHGAEAAATLARDVGVPGAEWFIGLDAFRHLTAVAASLDALVPGEGQITGQFRAAVRDHADAGLLDPSLHGTLQRVLAAARSVRADGAMKGRTKRSLADLALPRVPPNAHVAVYGTGQMARAVVERLGRTRVHHVVSQDIARASRLALDGPVPWDRSSFEAAAPPVDVLVLCTRSEGEPVVRAETVGALLRDRRAGAAPLLVLDLGLPRNADPMIAALAGVELWTIGDLARTNRGRLLDDPDLARARETLEHVVAAEAKRQATATVSEHVTAMRRSVAEALEELVTELEASQPGLDRTTARAVAHRTRGRLAHACQEHLMSAVQGRSPP